MTGETVKCKKCGTEMAAEVVAKHRKICPCCGYYFRMTARERIDLVADRKTFRELDTDLVSQDVLRFPDYEKKLDKAMDDIKKRFGDGAIVRGSSLIKEKQSLSAQEE